MAAFDTDPGRAALAAYFDECFARIAADDATTLPDPAAHLGAYVTDPTRMHVDFEIRDDDAEPARMECPAGTTGWCWKELRTEHGKKVWVWVCDCN